MAPGVAAAGRCARWRDGAGLGCVRAAGMDALFWGRLWWGGCTRDGMRAGCPARRGGWCRGPRPAGVCVTCLRGAPHAGVCVAVSAWRATRRRRGDVGAWSQRRRRGKSPLARSAEPLAEEAAGGAARHAGVAAGRRAGAPRIAPQQSIRPHRGSSMLCYAMLCYAARPSREPACEESESRRSRERLSRRRCVKGEREKASSWAPLPQE